MSPSSPRRGGSRFKPRPRRKRARCKSHQPKPPVEVLSYLIRRSIVPLAGSHKLPVQRQRALRSEGVGTPDPGPLGFGLIQGFGSPKCPADDDRKLPLACHPCGTSAQKVCRVNILSFCTRGDFGFSEHLWLLRTPPRKQEI
jgi:hypothetical protein